MKSTATLYPPYIIERSSRGERTYDIFSRLLMDRIVFLGSPINDDVANIIIAQLLFLDADVCIHEDTVSRIRERFQADPSLGAVFGSYDDAPEAPGVVSQFRNLLHCYIHHTSRHRATTFWAGCGAMTAEVHPAHAMPPLDLRHRGVLREVEFLI